MRKIRVALLVPALAASLVACSAFTQELPERTLDQMPRHDKFVKFIQAYGGLIDRGVQYGQWTEDGKSFTYTYQGKAYEWNSANRTAALANGSENKPPAKKGRPSRRAPDRGRQFSQIFSDDGSLTAVYRDGNVYLAKADGKNEVAVTTDGSEASRIKYGVASWVYGEELNEREAMWFSPDGKYLAFYRFDTTKVKDYFIAYDQLKDQDTLNAEPYPLPGTPNPAATLLVYNIATKKTATVDASMGDPSMSEYVFNVGWSPNGKELLFYRSNRKQNIQDYCAYNPVTDKSRVFLHEERTDGWIDTNRYGLLQPTWLKDKNRFIWISDRDGYRNLFLCDLKGDAPQQLTHLTADVERIALVDEDSGQVYFDARNGNNPYLMQLNRVGLNGKGEKRLTDPSLSHTANVSPNGDYFVDVAENAATPPTTSVVDRDGTVVTVLSHADVSAMTKLGVKPQERFTVKAADGQTTLWGSLSYPSDFDPNKKYPMLVFMYGGPESGGGVERYQAPDPICEYGFIIMTVDGRGSAGRGRAFMCSVYRKLGQYEIDDCAATVKQLAQRYSYIDGSRVGIQGTSYGGYFAALSILRYPDVYAASCASSPVTDFRLYDSIYTERYMGQPTPDDNEKGYVDGSCMTYAKNLKGWLMLYFGTADNNVHPSNTIRLASALEQAGKRFDLQLKGDEGHSQMNASRMWEYFITHLILDVPSNVVQNSWKAQKDKFAAIVAAAKTVPKQEKKKVVKSPF